MAGPDTRTANRPQRAAAARGLAADPPGMIRPPGGGRYQTTPPPRSYPMHRAALCMIPLLLAACTAPETAARRDGVRLEVEPPAPTAGGAVTLVLHNDVADGVGYNLCTSRLEREGAVGWDPVPEDRVCTLELRLLAPGAEDRFEVRLPPDLSPGTYRYSTSIERMPAGVTDEIASPAFRIGADP
jgi:hypothetical protein